MTIVAILDQLNNNSFTAKFWNGLQRKLELNTQPGTAPPISCHMTLRIPVGQNNLLNITQLLLDAYFLCLLIICVCCWHHYDLCNILFVSILFS